MIHDHSPNPPDRPRGARRAVRSLTFWLAASACADAALPDDAAVSTLSSDEVVALCDELRDAVMVTDQPTQCDSGAVQWVVPSNQRCRDADRTTCSATAGELRACQEWLRSDPCSASVYRPLFAYEYASAVSFGDPNSPPLSPACPFIQTSPDELFEQGCEPFLPVSRPIPSEFSCPPMGLASLQPYEGVYEVPVGFPSPASQELSCDAPLPNVLEAGARHFVLVATEASGTPEVLLKSCAAVADCQALAQQMRTAGAPLSAEPGNGSYHHLVGCAEEFGGETLLSPPRDDVPFCQEEWQPQVYVRRVPARAARAATLSLSTSANSPITDASPGCGYVIARSPREPVPCFRSARYDAVFVAPL